jgi:hypothetical protein
MPPRILAIETAVAALHILTLLDATLTIRDDDILQSQVVDGKKWPLTPEFFILYQFHKLIFLFCLQRYEKKYVTLQP